jgi:DNA-binding Xre family transcriptional regulator
VVRVIESLESRKDRLMRPKARWDTQPYQRMVCAKYGQGELSVQFENGDCVSLPIASLSRPSTERANWDAVTATPYEIVVPAAEGQVEIPWDTIRLLTDKEFDAYWAKAAEESARKTGTRLRELRERRSLSVEELAARAGITAEQLSRLEAGRAGIPLVTVETVLDAMGASLRDFV